MQTLFKILIDKKIASRRRFLWDVPTDGPGKWHSIEGDLDLVMKQRGFHVTTEPEMWLKNKCDIYECEASDGFTFDNEEYVFRNVRLIKKRNDLKPNYWIELEKFLSQMEKIDIRKKGRKGRFWTLYRDRREALSDLSYKIKVNAYSKGEIPYHVWTETFATANNIMMKNLKESNIPIVIAKEITLDFMFDCLLYAQSNIMKNNTEFSSVANRKMETWVNGFGNLYADEGNVMAYRI